MTASITADSLNRATLARQLLLERQALPSAEAIRRVTALQAQEPASSYIALWNRVARFDPTSLDEAFAGHAVLKATLMRITLHAVDASDYPRFRTAMEATLRASRLNDDRFRAAGITVAEADAIVPRLLAFASRPRTAAECEAAVDEWVGKLPKPGVWWALRTYAPLIRVGTGHAWTHGNPTTVLATPVPPSDEPVEDCIRHLALRYLQGFGPAGHLDLTQFTMLGRPQIRAALQTLVAEGEAIELRGPGGALVYDVPDGPRPAGRTPAPPRLLGMWDSILLAYADRGRMIPPEHRKRILRVNGDTLPTLLVDGRVAGVWRIVDARVEATAFEALPTAAWRGLAAEADALLAFVAGRDPALYRRYHHWWDKGIPGEVRILAG